MWPGWAAAYGCASQRPGCDPPPLLEFAARGHCGQSWGVLSRTSIFGEMFDARRHAHCAHWPSAAGGRRSLYRDFAPIRHLRPEDAGVCTLRRGDCSSDSKTHGFQSIPRDPHAMEGDAHTACCLRVWCLIELPLGRDWVCV